MWVPGAGSGREASPTPTLLPSLGGLQTSLTLPATLVSGCSLEGGQSPLQKAGPLAE